MLSKFLAISQKFLHAVSVVYFQKLFKAILETKLLVLVSQHSYIDD